MCVQLRLTEADALPVDWTGKERVSACMVEKSGFRARAIEAGRANQFSSAKKKNVRKKLLLLLLLSFQEKRTGWVHPHVRIGPRSRTYSSHEGIRLSPFNPVSRHLTFSETKRFEDE